MLNFSTLAWRTAVLGLLVVTVPISIHRYESGRQVDTETMLDVSVSIKTISHVHVDSVGDSVWNAATGSGLLVSRSNCEVLTNHHVVEDAAHIEVFPRKWPNSSGIPATVVSSNPRIDIAILRMSDCDGFPQVKLGNSDSASSGDEVYAVGNPLGKNPDSISRGILSHTERFNDVGIPYLQTDANINHGNSGGALFNRNGEVIGINTAILSTTSGSNFGIGYALPINLVKKEMQKLQAGLPSWGDAGIDNILAGLTPDEAAVFKVPDGLGAIIMTEDSVAGPASGILFAKDLIYKIDGADVVNVDKAKRIIHSYAAGESMRLAVIRKGEFINVDIELRDGWKAQESPAADYYDGYLGLTLEMWEEDRGGVKFETPVITQVKSLGPSHLAHIASSQKTMIGRGTTVFAIQLDVKTITGVVVEGKYYPVTSVAKLEQYAYEGYVSNTPLLLEIEVWAREVPMKFNEPFKRKEISFHKVMPEMTTALLPEMIDRVEAIAASY